MPGKQDDFGKSAEYYEERIRTILCEENDRLEKAGELDKADEVRFLVTGLDDRLKISVL